jgi:hypothetical protein
MKNLFLLYCVLVLAACGSKDNVSTQGDLPLLGGGGQGQTGPIDGGGTATPSTLIQIACQSGHGISLPNSQMVSGQRLVDIVPSLENRGSTSPTVLGVQGNIISTLFISGAKIYSSRFDFSTHAPVASPVVIGKASESSSSVYSELGFSHPRIAATSPNGRFFVISSGGSVSLRSVANPDQMTARWKYSGDFSQPRWDGNSIFIDKVSADHLRQAVISVDSNGNQVGLENAPAAISSGFQQIGLRNFDANSYIWLEHSADRAVLRLWNKQSGSVKNFELPNGKILGSGFALVRTSPEGGARAVLNSREGMHYFTLNGNGTVSAEAFLYPEDTQRRINDRENKVAWNPGAVYSTAGDTQVFVVLPATFGNNMLMAVDGFGYRLLGFETCVNPDFYRTRN